MMEAYNPNALEPLTIPQVIDRTFRIYRDNFIAFIGMVAIVTVPLNLLNLAITSGTQDAFTQAATSDTFEFSLPASFWLSIIIGIVILVIQSIVLNGLITYVASEYHMGRRVGVGEALTSITDRFLPLASALILVGVFVLVSFMILSVLSAICGLALLVFPVVFYLASTVYFFIVPVMILERVNVTTGLQRAMALGKARFWPTIGLLLLVALITLLISIVFGIIAGLAGGGVNQAGNLTATGTDLVTVLSNLIVNIIILPIVPIALTIMYYDVRVRVEGLDIALAAADKADPLPADVPSPNIQAPLLTRKDFGNILLLFLAFLGLSILIGILGVGLLGLAGGSATF